jgi:hypothetical protein
MLLVLVSASIKSCHEGRAEACILEESKSMHVREEQKRAK